MNFVSELLEHPPTTTLAVTETGPRDWLQTTAKASQFNKQCSELIVPSFLSSCDVNL